MSLSERPAFCNVLRACALTSPRTLSQFGICCVASCSKCLILLGTSGSAGHCVEVCLLSLMHAALVCYRRDPLLTLPQQLIELSQPLKSCGISLAQLLHMGGIGWPVSKRGKLGDDSLNQLIIVVAKGSLMTFRFA